LSVRGAWRLGIAREISLALAAVALLPLAVALLASIHVLLGQADIIESEVLWGKVKLAKLSYEGRLEGLSRALEAESRDNAILVNLELGLDTALSGNLEEFIRDQKLDGAKVYGPGGEAFASAGEEPPLDVSLDAPPASTSAALQPAFAIGGRAEDGAALVGTRRLASGTGMTVGYLRAFIRLRRLCSEASEAGKTPAFFILGSGEWIYSPEFAAGASASPAGPAGPAVPDALFKKGRDGESLQAVGAIAGVRYLLSVLGVPEGGISARLGVAYPEAKLADTRDRGIVSILLSGLLACALAGLGGIYFRGRITLPLLSLAKAARDIADGIYGAAVETGVSDEMGDLSRDFNRMSERLLEQEEEHETAESTLRASELQFRSIFDGVSDAIFVHDIDTGLIVDANKAMTAMYGLTREEAIRSDVDAMSEGKPPYDAEHAFALIRLAAAGENPVAEWRARRKDGELFWVEVALKRASIGGSDRILVTCRDITARKEAEKIIEESLREKETLLKEIHHRVKNNFQIINSLFDLQLMNTEDPSIREGIREPKARIHAMALIHERLYLSKDLSAIDFSDYIAELAQELFLSYNADPERIALEIDAEPVSLDMDRAIPCGLILNELMTNSLKYAFSDKGRRGRIAVALERRGDSIALRVEDDGAGFDVEAARESPSSLGLTLARMLSEQLKGSFTLESAAGVKATLVFPA
jgi:PAS domain S-box-containing protein